MVVAASDQSTLTGSAVWRVCKRGQARMRARDCSGRRAPRTVIPNVPVLLETASGRLARILWSAWRIRETDQETAERVMTDSKSLFRVHHNSVIATVLLDPIHLGEYSYGSSRETSCGGRTTSLEVAKRIADRLSTCPQPCTCPPWSERAAASLSHVDDGKSTGRPRISASTPSRRGVNPTLSPAATILAGSPQVDSPTR
jgi:hypothetical protein